MNDVRYALRLMRRSPGFTAVAVISLALGIGANTAIYSLFYTIMLRPLAVAHPEQLVEFMRKAPGEPRSSTYWRWEQYEYVRETNKSFSALIGTAFDNVAAIRPDGAEPERVILERVTGNYFSVLGVAPALGRFIGPDDVAAGTSVVVSWTYWDTHFHRDPSVIGKRIWYEDAPKTIVGVAPASYVGPRVGSRTDVWLPGEKSDTAIMGRLKPGVSMEQAQAEIGVRYRTWLDQRSTAPKSRQAQMELESAAAGFAHIRDQYGKPLTALIAVVGLLLLLTCANMASLLLARSASRRREMAVRISLGASGWRLVKASLTESLLLSGAGTLGGVVCAYFGTGVLVRIMATSRVFERIEVVVQPDAHLLLATAAFAIFTGVLFGLAPAAYAFHTAPADALRQSGAGGDSRAWRAAGRALVTAQVALSILLVTAAVASLAHLDRLRHVDFGFDPGHVLLITFDPSHTPYKRAELAGPYRDLLTRISSLPQVRSASITGCTPLEGCGSGSRYLIAEGQPAMPEERMRTSVVFVAPRYFETMGIPLVAGRDFAPSDLGTTHVAILSRAAARHYFPGDNPIGKHVTIDRNPAQGGWFTEQPYEIIGLAGDTRAIELRDPFYPTIYFDMFQDGRIMNQFEVRTSGDPDALAAAILRMSRDVLHNVPATKVSTMERQVDSNIVPERLMAVLSEFFGALGALLAGVGLYGLLAYTVARRTGEIGIRMALGATAGRVRRLVLVDVAGMVAAGISAGMLAMLWAKPFVARLLPDLQMSFAPLVAGAMALVAVACMAAFLPVRRATNVDPIAALRSE